MYFVLCCIPLEVLNLAYTWINAHVHGTNASLVFQNYIEINKNRKNIVEAERLIWDRP